MIKRLKERLLLRLFGIKAKTITSDLTVITPRYFKTKEVIAGEFNDWGSNVFLNRHKN